MSTHQAANKCVSELNGAQLHGSTIYVGWASRNRKLFVSSLPMDISLESLLALFEAHGPVIQDGCRLCTSDSGNKHATVEFERRQDAERARDQWNGTLFGGSYMIVNWDQSMSARLQKGSPTGGRQDSPSALPDKKKGAMYSDFPYFSVHVSFRCHKVCS
jgi:RNA recognition motif-containing protein